MTSTLTRTSWETLPLAEVAEIERNAVASDQIEAGSRYVGLEDISSFGQIENFTEVSPGDIASTKFHFTSDHVLYGKLRPYLSKIALPDFEGICSTDILPVLPGERLDRRFLCYFLRQPHMVEFATRRSTGANLPRLSPTRLAEFEIPLPPLSEQKRIADILDKADAIRRKREDAHLSSDALIDSEFRARFGDPVANSQQRELVPLTNYGTVTTGNTPSRKNPENYGDKMEWIKSDNINTPSHWLTSATENLSEDGLRKARTVPAGATLVTCIAGSPSCVGNAAMADREVAFNQQINAVTPAKEVDPYFLYVLILLSKPRVQRASTASMKGMVSKGKFERIQVVKADQGEQYAFGIAFQQILSLIRRQADGATAACDLFNSLVQRAFKGEL